MKLILSICVLLGALLIVDIPWQAVYQFIIGLVQISWVMIKGLYTLAIGLLSMLF